MSSIQHPENILDVKAYIYSHENMMGFAPPAIVMKEEPFLKMLLAVGVPADFDLRGKYPAVTIQGVPIFVLWDNGQPITSAK